MSCQNCRDALAVNGEIVPAINSVYEEDCACEAHSLSDLSPGPVGDDEDLHFFVRDQDGLAENGLVHRNFVLQAFRNGLSVLRNGAADSEFSQTIEELKDNWIPKGRNVHGVITFKAASVRYNEDQRLCGVYDTGLPGKPLHADLMAATVKTAEGVSPKAMKERALLMIIQRMGSAFTPAAELRGGIFKDQLSTAA